MSYFNPEIHHRKSIRLKGFDYSQSGSYFVTINLGNIRCMLAGWKNALLNLSAVGAIVNKYWQEIPLHYPNAEMDEYIIMPDHLHGVISIDGHVGVSTGYNPVSICKGVQLNAPTGTTKNESHISQSNVPAATVTTAIVTTTTDTAKQTDPYFASLSPSGGTLSVIIRNYKASVTRWCKTNGYPQFKWQRNFHEHIIRNDEELQRIRRYIRNNPEALLKEFPGLTE